MVRPRKLRAKLPDHVHCVMARGKPYYYFQKYRGTLREEPRLKMPGEPYGRDGVPNAAWWAKYRELAGEALPAVRAGTFSVLINAYQASPEWCELSERTKGLWGPLLKKIDDKWSGLPVKGLQPKHVLALRDAYADRPGMANNLMRALSSLMAWSVSRGWREHNPCTGLRKLKGGEGYGPWTWEQIEYFRTHASKPELWWAAALALYSGQRQSDCLAMRWINIQNDWISVRQSKTGKRLRIPMHRNLKAVLSVIPKRSLTVLSNTREAPWTADGFKTSWSKELARPEMSSLRGLVFHGLRKSAVVFLLEAGCTGAEVAAITGQSLKMVEHYAQRVNQEKLAAAAVLKWEASI